MKSAFVQLKEYDKIESKDISCCDIEQLEKYLERNNLSSALKVTPSGVKARSYVGVIKFKNTQFEILPKLVSASKSSNETILNNLVFMLSYTKRLSIKTTASAKLAQAKNPFLEVLIREYAQSLFDCLKRLTPKNYIREEDNLNYLKGKMKFSENIRYNCANQAKFYCEFDDFNENCILNQLLNYVSICLHSISQDSNNKKLLKFIMNYYSDIKLVRFDKFSCQKIRLNRNQQLFEKPFNLAKMFIENSSVDLSKNKFENITLLWDMNKLFEEFIFQVIKRHFLDKTVEYQKGKRLLRTKNSTYYDTDIDILFDKKLIIDAKYKKLEKFKDVSSSDIYQISTYSLLNNLREAVLLYPMWGNEKPSDIEEFYRLNTFSEYSQCDYKLRIEVIDLKENDLQTDLKNKDSKIINQIKNILFKKEDN